MYHQALISLFVASYDSHGGGPAGSVYNSTGRIGNVCSIVVVFCPRGNILFVERCLAVVELIVLWSLLSSGSTCHNIHRLNEHGFHRIVSCTCHAESNLLRILSVKEIVCLVLFQPFEFFFFAGDVIATSSLLL